MRVNQANSQKLGLSKRPSSSYSEIHAHQIHSSSQSLTSFMDLPNFKQNSQLNKKQSDPSIRMQHLYSPSMSTKGAKSERIGSFPSSNLTSPIEKYQIEFTSNGTASQKQLLGEQEGKRSCINEEQSKVQLQSNRKAEVSSFKLDLAAYSKVNTQQNGHHPQVYSPEIEEYYQELRQDIAQVSESNRISSWNYQNTILENELYLSSKQSIYTEKQPEHLKREIMNHIEMRHREEIRNLQEAWEKEKAILARTVNLQKLRLLDNERIMLQMEGDLEQVKSLADRNINSCEDNPNVISSFSERRLRNGQQIIQNITNNTEKIYLPISIASPVRNQKLLSQDKSSPLMLSSSEKKLPQNLLFFHKRNTSTAVSTPNPLHHKRLGSNVSDASNSVFQSNSTVKHVHTFTDAKFQRDQVDNQKLLSPEKITSPPQTKQLVKEIFFQNKKIFGPKTSKSQANSLKQVNNLSIQSPQNYTKKYSQPDLSSPKQVSSVKNSSQAEQKSIALTKQDQASDKVLGAHKPSKSINNCYFNQTKQKDTLENKKIQSKP